MKDVIKWNPDTLWARLYRWFYKVNEMPPNLCPYFWKSVIMGMIIIPYSILCIPVILLELYDMDGVKSSKDRSSTSIVIYFLIFIVFAVLFSWFTFWVDFDENGIWDYFRTLGYAMDCIILIVLLGYLISWLHIQFKRGYHHADGHTNIITEMIKSKYNKYCPKIDWKDEK